MFPGKWVQSGLKLHLVFGGGRKKVVTIPNIPVCASNPFRITVAAINCERPMLMTQSHNRPSMFQERNHLCVGCQQGLGFSRTPLSFPPGAQLLYRRITRLYQRKRS